MNHPSYEQFLADMGMADSAKKPYPPIDNRLVTVCDKCLMASCWHGIFMCHQSRTAGLVEKTVTELRSLALEHEDYFIPHAKEVNLA